MTALDKRDKLLAAVLDRLTGAGLGDMSLRALADAVGTSHRMLIYHFGSKEGLLIEVVRAMEERQRVAMTELVAQVEADPSATPADAMLRFWHHLADPALWAAERLFFELYGQALQGRPGTTPFLDGIVESTVEPMTAVAARFGSATPAADARLGVAVTRGLLLDLLATKDRAAVDAAMARFVSMYFDSLG